MATLKDLARTLGLSVTQVSRALNGHADVSAETAARVRAAAEAAEYRPNIAARRLASGRGGMVALVAFRGTGITSDSIFLETIAGLSSEFATRGIPFVLHVAEPGAPERPIYERLLATGSVDGFVLIDPREDDLRLALLRARGVPFVLHGRTSQGRADYPFYDIDNEAVGAMLTRCLLEAGHRHIALVNGIKGRTYVSARTRGWLGALAGAGVAPGPELHGDMEEALGLTAAIRLFGPDAPRPRPTGVICGHMRIASGLLQGLAALRLRVPQDVSVVAHDDVMPGLSPAAFTPPLTVTRVPLRESWAPLVEHFCAVRDGRPLAEAQKIATPAFHRGESVAPPRNQDA